MKLFVRFLSFALVTVIGASADPSLSVFASLAPNRWGSPSYNGYAANALTALQNNGSPIGNPATDPTAYSAVTAIYASENVVTGFPSWLGNANPSGNFASELGNRLTFGLYVNGNGTEFTAGDISFTMTSGDGNILGYTETIAQLGSGTGAYGTSGTASTPVLFGDVGGTWQQITDASTTVSALAFVGMGNAPAAYVTSGETNQQSLDAAILSAFPITGTYTLSVSGDQFTGSATVDPAPEPSTVVFLGTVVAGIWTLRRKVMAR